MSVRSAPELSVVVSTYAWPEALDAVLRALADQDAAGFEVIVADDGSSAATEAVVERWQSALGGRLQHVWQPDEGFRLARVRNLGALAARGDFLAFIDGDTVPRRGFVSATRQAALPGWFLGGKLVRISRGLTDRVLRGNLAIHRWSLLGWAWRGRWDTANLVNLTGRDRRRPGRKGLPDFVPHAEAWGAPLVVSREDFERANGYDARFVGWGEEDIDLALRLRRLGLRSGWPGPQGTLLHLWHETRKDRGPNIELREETRAGDRVEAVVGLRELAAQESANSTTGSGAAPFSSGGT